MPKLLLYMLRLSFWESMIPVWDQKLTDNNKTTYLFFYWTAWVASATRPGKDYSYTNNWPADRSVGNVATTETYIWTLGGIMSLIVTLGLFIFWVHRNRLWYGEAKGIPLAEKLIDMPLISSQLKAAKYFKECFQLNFLPFICNIPLR